MERRRNSSVVVDEEEEQVTAERVAEASRFCTFVFGLFSGCLI